MKYHISLQETISQLQHSDQPFIELLKHGTLAVEYYVPRGVDTQTPHEQDEIYIIAAGQSEFFRNGEVFPCAKGDLLFVPAGMEHRFLNFSNDFATWVIFYGQKGGDTISLPQ